MLTHKQLRTRALADPTVKAEFDKLSDEFSLLDEFLKARTSQGLTQAQLAERIAPPICRSTDGIRQWQALALIGNADQVRRRLKLQAGNLARPQVTDNWQFNEPLQSACTQACCRISTSEPLTAHEKAPEGALSNVLWQRQGSPQGRCGKAKRL